ncbi:MAG: hypothetical protein SH848_19365 [Saprospiraceae bacterium]|nr:hypothetical protein [Saprospiraceae bacterium]
MTEGLILSFFLQLRNNPGFFHLEMRHFGDLLLLLREDESQESMKNSDSLKNLCRTLWLADSRRYGSLFDHLFKSTFESSSQESTMIPPEHPEISKPKPNPIQEIRPRKPLQQPEQFRRDKVEPLTTEPDPVKTLWIYIEEGDENTEAKRGSYIHREFDLSNNFHPVSSHLLQQRWRMLFRTERISSEKNGMDVAATVSALNNGYILSSPLYKKEWTYSPCIVLLIDQLGSMEPFEELGELIRESLENAFPKDKIKVFYFYNEPGSVLFTNPSQTEAISNDDFFRRYVKSDNSIVIFSDAGAYRRDMDPDRIINTLHFLKETQSFRHRIWLNPVPRSRWNSKAIEAIMAVIQMTEVSHTEISLLPKHYGHIYPTPYDTDTKLISAEAIEKSAAEVRPYLMWYNDRYAAESYEYWQFLVLAAFMPAFSTDMLYKLRKNMAALTGKKYDPGKQIHYSVVADLILSPLCRKLGMGLFEVRKELQENIWGQETYKNNLIELNSLRLSRFLEEYAKDSENSYLPTKVYWEALMHRVALATNYEELLGSLLAISGNNGSFPIEESSIDEHFEYLKGKDGMDAAKKEGIRVTLAWAKALNASKSPQRNEQLLELTRHLREKKPQESNKLNTFCLPVPMPDDDSLAELIKTSMLPSVTVEPKKTDEKFIGELMDSYAIQQYEDRLRKNGQLTLEYYFDSVDVINLIQGGWAYETGMEFKEQAYRRDREKITVYAFAFQGLLGTIRMLEPHRLEVTNKLDRHEYFLGNPTKVEYKQLVKQVLQANQLDHNKPIVSLNVHNIDDNIKQLINEGADLFRANYLLREYTWEKRLKYLITRNPVRLSFDGYGFQEISDYNLFTKIKAGFDSIRPQAQMSYNNIHDATSLYYLQKKLSAHIKDKKQPLPVFFASSFAIWHAVKFIQKQDPDLFTYPSEGGSFRRIPIIRDALFFILEPLFQIGGQTEDFLKKLQDSKDSIRVLIQREYNQYRDIDRKIVSDMETARKDFENKVKGIIEAKFIQDIWIGQGSYRHLISDLKQSFEWNDEDIPLVEEGLKSELQEVLEDAKKSLQRSKEWSAIVEAFREINQDAKRYLPKSVGSLDIFRDYGLIRFGIDKQKLDGLQDIIESLINVPESRLPEAYIISLLMTQPKTEAKTVKLLLGITVAWILEKNDLIVTLCEQFSGHDMQRRYEIALIFGAAFIAAKKNAQGINRTQSIINDLLSKKDNNYRIWLGVSFLYYRMWEADSKQRSDIPEINSEEWKALEKRSSYEKYIIYGAIYYADKACSYLKKRLMEDEIQEGYRLLSYLYALNNVIYYTTKSGNTKAFLALENLVEELEGHEYRTDVWQGRFYDTLGWYDLRKAFLSSKNVELYQGYLKKAEMYYNSAMENIALPRDRTLYRQLHDGIQKVREHLINS